MKPFRIDQQQYLQHNIINRCLAIAAYSKTCDIPMIQEKVLEIEQIIRKLPAYACDHQELYDNIYDPFTCETGPAMVCVFKNRRCPYTSTLIKLCPDISHSHSCVGVDCKIP